MRVRPGVRDRIEPGRDRAKPLLQRVQACASGSCDDDAVTTSVVWQPQSLASGSVSFAPGQRYAVLASVESGTSLATIQKYVAGKGFTITYLCEVVAGSPQACANRDQYDIDTWLANITAKPRSGERWVYAEGNFTGSAPWEVTVTDSFPKTLVVTYSIASMFEAVARDVVVAPGGGSLPVAPVTPPGSASSGAGYVVVGAAAMAAGLLWWLL
jgi:hypothetical protein